jgi:predicted phosphodiesterase
VRVAALNDIEGNLPALEAVLAEAEDAGVDAVVCGGDVVTGPFPAEVFDRLASLAEVHFLRGNLERLVVDGVDEYGRDWSADRLRLGDARLAAIASWPLTVELDIEGVGRTLFCHAIPTDDEPIFTHVTSDDDVADLLGDLAADVVVCGHTHIQFDRRLANDLRVVNAGSVGRPFERPAGAYWALLGPGVDLRRTTYDVAAAVDSMRGAGADVDDELLDDLLEPPDRDETTARFESARGGRA